MNNEQLAIELIRIARLLTGWIHPDRNVGSSNIIQQYNRIRSIPDVCQRATIMNLVSEIAMHGKDRSGLTRKPGFRGWGREDFMRLRSMVACICPKGIDNGQ